MGLEGFRGLHGQGTANASNLEHSLQNGKALYPLSRPSAPHLSHLDGTYELLGREGNDLNALIVNSPTKTFPRP